MFKYLSFKNVINKDAILINNHCKHKEQIKKAIEGWHSIFKLKTPRNKRGVLNSVFKF